MPGALNPLVHQLLLGDIVLMVALILLTVWAVCAVLVRLGQVTRDGRTHALAQFGWQLGALLGLEQAYEFTRGRIPHETDIALMNAYRVLDIEWKHGFFVEARIERFFLQFSALMNAIDLLYVLAHVAVTVGALIWIYIWHRQHYPFVRTLLMLTTAIALVVFYLYPTAPPRMLGNYGFVDPLQLHHLVAAGGAEPGSFTYNPYAAMPSLHVGYALVMAWGVMLATRRLWVRILACLYPIFMSAIVVISGNHWLLDVVGAVATVGVAALIIGVVSQLRSLCVAWRLRPVTSS